MTRNALLSDRGAAVPDAQDCRADGAMALRYLETQRAVAEYIALGAWCDPLAWAAIFTEHEHLEHGEYAIRLRRKLERERRDLARARARARHPSATVRVLTLPGL